MLFSLVLVFENRLTTTISVLKCWYMNNLYQLVGPKYLAAGNKVDMGPVGDRWGIIVKVQQEDYKLPNPCVVTGQTPFHPQPVNLFLIRGGDFNSRNDPLPTVWGFQS